MKLMLTTLITLAAASTAFAGAHTEKKGGIKITIAAAGKQDDLPVFKFIGDSSNRKDDKRVDGVIHLLDADGAPLSDCPFSIVVPALKKQAADITCTEDAEYAQFAVEVTSVAASD